LSPGEALFEKGLLNAPDHIINSGGITDIHRQQQGVRDSDRINSHPQVIRSNLAEMFIQSDRQSVSLII
jgi:leucine dehydrogenase